MSSAPVLDTAKDKLFSGWLQMITGEVLPQAPVDAILTKYSYMSKALVDASWDRAMQVPSLRKAAFLFQVIINKNREFDVGSALADLQGRFTFEDFGKALKMSETEDIEHLKNISLDLLFNSSLYLQPRKSGRCGIDYLSLGDIKKIEALIKGYILTFDDEEIVGNLLMAGNVFYEKDAAIQRMGWECYFKDKQVAFIPPGCLASCDRWRYNPLDSKIARLMASSAQKEKSLQTLKLRGMKLSCETVRILKGSGKKIDISGSQLEGVSVSHEKVVFVILLFLFSTIALIGLRQSKYSRLH